MKLWMTGRIYTDFIERTKQVIQQLSKVLQLAGCLINVAKVHIQIRMYVSTLSDGTIFSNNNF